MRRTLTALIVLAMATGPAMAGCGLVGGGASGLRRALGQIAATADTRVHVAYSNTAALVKLSGKGPGAQTGYAGVRLFGTEDLVQVSQNAPGDTGISALDADHAITAGRPPHRVTLVSGGQNPDKVGTALQKLGWTRTGDRYVAPSLDRVASSDPLTGQYALTLAQVQGSGHDVTFGSQAADLGTAAHPGGKRLSDDAQLGRLADCLGDPVVADIDADTRAGLPVVAIGVRTPKADSDTPHVAVCTAWPDQAAADRYAAKMPGVLADSTDPVTNSPYAQRLHSPSVKNLGGDSHIVSWQVDTPGPATLIFQMLANRGLPGLADCSRAPSAARQQPACA